MSTISLEKTSLTLGVVISLTGGIIWLTTLHIETQSNAASIQEISNKLDAREKFERDALERLARIETLLKVRSKEWTPKRGD